MYHENPEFRIISLDNLALKLDLMLHDMAQARSDIEVDEIEQAILMLLEKPIFVKSGRPPYKCISKQRYARIIAEKCIDALRERQSCLEDLTHQHENDTCIL